MRRLLAALLVLAGGLQVCAEEHGMPRRAAPVRLMAGLGDHRHPIATAEPEAQRFFDQGLNLVFAFNHEEAVRSFARAAVLESVLNRDPLHPGANHYYVHAVEASPHPERALPSAARLETLVPGAGHLVHMPAHIYMRTGDYLRAAQANERAVEADRAYVAEGGHEMYAPMYYAHDFHFMAAAYAMAGRGAAAQRAAGAVVATTRANAGDLTRLDPAGVAMVDLFLMTPTFVGLRVHDWAGVLAAPAPDGILPVSPGLWHFARGVAFAATGKRREARAEREALEAARRALPADAMFGYSRGADVLELAAAVLDARLAEAGGDRAGAVMPWRRAVEVQDRLNYDEPPDWYYPVRESLGGALLRAGRPAEAETVFRADLARNPRNPRSLFGLAESLRAQKKAADAAWVRAAFEGAWRDADTQLTSRDP